MHIEKEMYYSSIYKTYWHSLNHFFLADLDESVKQVAQKLEEHENIQEVKWVSLEELSRFDFSDYQKQIKKKIIENKDLS